jgi:hypothetical protein
MHVYFLRAQEFHLGIPGTHAVCRGRSEEDVRKCTLNKVAGRWLAQEDDFRTFLGEFVSSLPQVELFGALH